MRADSQRTRVYAWEWASEQLNDTPLSRTSCERIVRYACALYGVPTPSVQVCESTHGRKSYYDELRNHIKLVYKHRTPLACLHEAAHAITSRYYGNAVQDHGPEWLGIYCWLILHMGLARPKWLRLSLKNAGLKAKPTRIVAPYKLKRMRKKRA